MSSSREQNRLHDIIENIDAIDGYIAGMDHAMFAADQKTVDAVERCLSRIAEAVVKIGTDRMNEIDPDLPVERVRGLGNLLRHEYDLIDLRLIYNLLLKDLPPMRASCVAALEG